MSPEAGYKLALVITMLVQPFLEEFIGKETRLWQSVHSFGDLHKNHTVFVYLATQVVVLDNLLGQVREFYTDVFGSRKRCH